MSVARAKLFSTGTDSVTLFTCFYHLSLTAVLENAILELYNKRMEAWQSWFRLLHVNGVAQGGLTWTPSYQRLTAA